MRVRVPSEMDKTFRSLIGKALVGRVSDAGSSPVAQIMGLWCSGNMVGLDPTDPGSIPGNPFQNILFDEQYIQTNNDGIRKFDSSCHHVIVNSQLFTTRRLI